MIYFFSSLLADCDLKNVSRHQNASDLQHRLRTPQKRFPSQSTPATSENTFHLTARAKKLRSFQLHISTFRAIKALAIDSNMRKHRYISFGGINDKIFY